VSKTDASYAAGALENIAHLRNHLTLGSLDQQLVIDAVCMRLGAALEEASHITPEARELAFGGRWPAMWATRNRIAHGYLEIDSGTIAATVGHDLDDFEAALRSLAGGAPA
jgi:uncharacterized protein with HEPN domain